MKYQETIWYEDELTDDFGTTVKKRRPLPKKYKYVSKNVFFLLFEVIIYRLIVRPLAWIYMKIKFHHKIVNRKVAKGIKSGYFIYSNHSTIIADAFMPNILNFSPKNYIITGEQTNSLTLILPILKAIGALPLTDNLHERKGLMKAIKYRISKNCSVTIYPEAHVWPYYTDIRPFSSESFKYASKLNVPIICMTNCFQKKRFGKKPKIVSFVDGPFYPDKDLNSADAAQQLRDQVYSCMKKRTKEYSTYSYFNYKKKDTK